jgi:hypothetical protein
MSAGRVKCAGEIRNFSRVIIPPLNLWKKGRGAFFCSVPDITRDNVNVFLHKNI